MGWEDRVITGADLGVEYIDTDRTAYITQELLIVEYALGAFQARITAIGFMVEYSGGDEVRVYGPPLQCMM